MSILSLLLISCSLAMDAFAVSISAGLSLGRATWRQMTIVALVFGGFQAVMPLIGWLGGYGIREYIEPVDHWIVFGLLGIIGVNMIREAYADDDGEVRDYLTWSSLITLGIATSIDALAVGVSLAMMPIDIISTITMIGVVTTLWCALGVWIGSRFGHVFEKKAEIIGGLILIAMGTKILVEHLA